MIRLVREGAPVGKARARKGKTGRWYTPQKTRDAEEEWQWLFVGSHYQSFLEDVPLSVTIRAYMKDPMKRLDADNIAKLVLDSLGNGLAYADDKQIVELHVYKMKGEPRTEVVIEESDMMDICWRGDKLYPYRLVSEGVHKEMGRFLVMKNLKGVARRVK